MKNKCGLLQNLYNALILHKYPVYLVQFVTERCNARCPHCFVDLKTESNELKIDEIEKITKTTGKCLRNISITGGEPFLRDDIIEIASMWHKNSSAKSIVVTSNGSMPERIENFVKQAVKDDMPVSFFFSYDFIEEKHSEYRKLKNLHKNVIESYRIVHKYYPKINASFSLTVAPNTYETAFETYQYMRDVLKIQNININMIRGAKADCIPSEERKEIAKVYSKIAKTRDYDFDKMNINGYDNKSLTTVLLNAKNKILWKKVLQTFEQNKYISPCHACSLSAVIYSNGDVAPCELRKTILNLKDYDFNFIDCWNSDKSFLTRKKIKNSKCFCTNECNWLVNLFASPRYYPEIFYTIIKNYMRGH